MGFSRRSLGRTGLEVSAVGIGGGYGIKSREIRWAFDHGINYFFWAPWMPTYRRMEKGLKDVIASNREDLVIATAAYSWIRSGSIEASVTKHLKRLGLDRIDVFFLGWVMKESQERAIDDLMALKEKGLVRCMGFSGHKRGLMAKLLDKWPFDVVMVRYNAAHPGAEQDVFPKLPDTDRPGVVAFNALKHGQMLKRPRTWPADRPLPTAAQCYRFALSHPSVDVCLAGPGNARQVEELAGLLEQGPLSAEEMEFMKKFGDARHG